MVPIVLVSFLLVIPDYVWIIFSNAVKSQNSLLILVLIFALTTISLVWSVGQRIDVWVFTYFNMHGRRRSWLDGTMLFLTQLGNGIFAMILSTLLYFLGHHVLAYAFVLGTLSLWFVVELIKMLVHRTRPYQKIENSRIVGSRARGCSFPSGHTSQSFFMATFLLPYFSRQLFYRVGWLSAGIFGRDHPYLCRHALPPGCPRWGDAGNRLGTVRRDSYSVILNFTVVDDLILI